MFDLSRSFRSRIAGDLSLPYIVVPRQFLDTTSNVSSLFEDIASSWLTRISKVIVSPRDDELFCSIFSQKSPHKFSNSDPSNPIISRLTHFKQTFHYKTKKQPILPTTLKTFFTVFQISTKLECTTLNVSNLRHPAELWI